MLKFVSAKKELILTSFFTSCKFCTIIIYSFSIIDSDIGIHVTFQLSPATVPHINSKKTSDVVIFFIIIYLPNKKGGITPLSTFSEMQHITDCVTEFVYDTDRKSDYSSVNSDFRHSRQYIRYWC